jgi:hypothetical protein
MLKVATLCSQEGDLSRAAAIFETLGNEAMETKLGSYSAKGYFFQCVLCHMALGDFVASKAKTDAFKSADFNFPSSRECQFLSQLQEVCYLQLIFVNRCFVSSNVTSPPFLISSLSLSLSICRLLTGSMLMLFLKLALTSIASPLWTHGRPAYWLRYMIPR